MSEQWHQHLQNLTFWEEIDRLFNPSKYSCSTYSPMYDQFYQVMGILILVICIGVFAVMLLLRKYTITITEKETSTNSLDSSTDTQQESK